MKKILLATALCVLAFASGAQAQPEAKEIAFARPCPSGVPVYNKADDKVACGQLAQSGSGYVIEMASQHGTPTTCPKGFAFIGTLNKESLAQRGITDTGSLQYFACVKE